ncbi:7-cyano-7-deazaguanine/7-aminomethyl-7-deazaguanine transporter [Corallincola holothuriorum]|uniref:Probable queuosine precursor transporter n=1 Tax=Corallincola holothuriorum TaxID=2282215 RepID=A0A368NHC9_9GAMM|nr:7-cyano-7-deazaguanine/7-aminomethyl-7-deazaguanine transporter [Corallincola holothuriorum]RCU49997.1 7-cyano-7-deazaguanine/7-aminomethyl-7-deazaguanine transporter [Corallincola holothuriorum]
MQFLQLTEAQRRGVFILAMFHIVTITASNYLVQLPFTLFGFHTTWGAFTFPFIFLATDLTVRLVGAARARQVVFLAMVPALIASYLISVLFFEGQFQGASGLYEWNGFVARIALASFLAFAVGQLLDILVFNRLRQLKTWWIAPAGSSIFGNGIDTLLFFSVAFYASSDAFMAEHWLEIAWVDYGFKLIVNLALFVPLYGMLLNYLQRRFFAVQPAY